MKKKSVGIISALIVTLCTFVLSACNFTFDMSWFKPDLEAPTIVLNSDNKEISWYSVEHAEEYDVYINNSKVVTTDNRTGKNILSFEQYITNDIVIYKLYIIACASGYNNSPKSNDVTYLSNDSSESISSSYNISNSYLDVVGNIYVNGKVLIWDEVDSVSKNLCSELHERNVLGYNGVQVKVSYDDCNPFGMIAGDFGEITNIHNHITNPVVDSTIDAFNSLSQLFDKFMGNFEIPTDGTEYFQTINSDTLVSYTNFYNKAMGLYKNSLAWFTQGDNSELTKSAVIGVNYPYTITFETGLDLEVIDFQTVIANLFGFNSKIDFMNYAQELANTYSEYKDNVINFGIRNKALENGCFYTSNGSFVFPIAIKNELPSTILAYVILDNNGLVSVWVNDITATLMATNYNSTYGTDNVINNKLYCKNMLFVKGLNKYYVYLYSNALGERMFETEINAFDFSKYVTDDEVVIFRVGIEANNAICLSNMYYHNTCNVVPSYNSKYFYIDGYVGDMYITSQEELNKLVYYGFIYKKSKLDIYISKDFMTTIYNKYGPERYVTTSSGNRELQKFYHLQQIISIACSSFVESCDYDTSLENVTSSNYQKNDITIKFNFASVEPTEKMQAVRQQSKYDVPYYETVSYSKRSVDFNDFQSDKCGFIEIVETGEQLYHAVESGATPKFTSTSSSAYVLYNKAKQVLREIICDEMTDYEKVLSIFDYICYNTVYDDSITTYNPTSSQPSFIAFSSFFIEGVLNDGLAVCDGFSKTFSLLCNMEGIKAQRITGSVSGGLHAWNKVKIDGNWYVVDITWTVTKTGSNDFTTDENNSNYNAGSVYFNAKEFLSYKYFLVSDSFISGTHKANDSTLNLTMPANNDYYFYLNMTYDGEHNRIITSDKDFEAIVNYMLKNKMYGMEVVFSQSYIPLPSSFSTTHDTMLSQACKRVKQACGFPDGNILIIGVTSQKVSASQKGSIYSITLINLPDSLTNTDTNNNGDTNQNTDTIQDNESNQGSELNHDNLDEDLLVA